MAKGLAINILCMDEGGGKNSDYLENVTEKGGNDQPVAVRTAKVDENYENMLWKELAETTAPGKRERRQMKFAEKRRAKQKGAMPDDDNMEVDAGSKTTTREEKDDPVAGGSAAGDTRGESGGGYQPGVGRPSQTYSYSSNSSPPTYVELEKRAKKRAHSKSQKQANHIDWWETSRGFHHHGTYDMDCPLAYLAAGMTGLPFPHCLLVELSTST